MKIKHLKMVKSSMKIFAIVLALSVGYALHVQALTSFTGWIQQLRSFTLVPTKNTESKDDVIQVALLLDTSNSMDGLINQAKSQLWRIVSELSRVEKNDQTANIEIALYEYGNDRLSSISGFIRQITPFTRDMDLVSKELFALTTNGGSEYCGAVIHQSLKNLQWGSGNGLKMIYIAGNESFNQGNFSPVVACHNAKKKDILVNTIFCGGVEEGIGLKWKQGASLTGGEYMHIDHNAQTVYIDSPYDDRISELNEELNKTYMPYGDDGANYLFNMNTQDANAEKLSKANKVDRAVFKSKKQYSNEKWDLVDAFKKDQKIVKEKSKLPSKYKGKTEKEIEADILANQTKRDEIQKEIKELDAKRRGFIQEKEAVMQSDSISSLDKNILNSVKKQAKKKGYKIEK